MAVDSGEAAVVLRIFREFAEGHAESAIVRRLNQEGVTGRRRQQGKWSPATVLRIPYVFKRVEQEVREMGSEVPATIRLKEAELDAEERRVANFVEFIAEGRGSKALAGALTISERKSESLKADLEALRQSRDEVFAAPPLAWIEERAAKLQEVLERRTAASALLMRNLLGRIRLEPVTPNIGRPYLRAAAKLQVLELMAKEATPPDWEANSDFEPDGGSNSLQWWTRSQRIGTFGRGYEDAEAWDPAWETVHKACPDIEPIID